MGRPGRRPGESQTREEILAAARNLFGAKGYAATTIRGIAAEAGVNPALVHHYFKSKERVFVAALHLATDPVEVAAAIADGPLADMGERIVRSFLAAWRSSDTNAPMLALFRSVSTHDEASTMLREFLESAVLERVANLTGVPKLRLSAAVGQMVGLVFLRHVIKAEPLASADEEDIVELVAPVVQRYIDGA